MGADKILDIVLEKINSLKHFDIYIIIIMSALFLITMAIIPSLTIIRILLGIPFLLFFPGYTIVSTLWPEKNSQITLTERIGISIGLSIALVSLIGLGLNYSPWGLNLWPVLSITGLFIFLMSNISIVRRNKTKNPFIFEIRLGGVIQKKMSRKDRVFFAVLFLGMGLFICALTYRAVVTEPDEKFSAIYILGPNGRIGNYPDALTENETAVVIVGVYNHEFSEKNYTIVVSINKNATTEYVQRWNQTLVLTNDTAYAFNFTLRHDETWKEPFSFSINEKGKHRVTWYLFINGKETKYYNYIWVEVS